MKTNLDLINECDNFPCQVPSHNASEGSPASYWEFYLQGEEAPVGLLLDWVVDKMPWNLQHWEINRETRSVTSKPQAEASHGAIIAETLAEARKLDVFEVLRGWRSELYPVYGHHKQNKQGIGMERSGSPLFGINTFGVHMTAYVNTPDGMMIWVPRRSISKQTYGGKLDNTVAGGLAINETPFDCLVREASEEASFPEDLVRAKAKSCGTVSYFLIRDDGAGGENGLLQPECQYVYDIELPENIRPKPNDSEVEIFYLWGIQKVQEALRNGEFKPNCALVLLDFFIRHGILTPENEPHYIEIISRLHRILPFPTP